MKEIRKYVDQNFGINSSALSDNDVTKLAIFHLKAISYETPKIAKINAQELNLKF